MLAMPLKSFVQVTLHTKKEDKPKDDRAVGRIYELERKVFGAKKQVLMPAAVTNPQTGRLTVSCDEIKNITLQYCKDISGKQPS